MYCPSCRTQFDWTETECPECGVELVEVRPGPAPDPGLRLTTLFSTGNAGLIALAKSLLDGENIEYLVRAESVQDLFGCGRLFAGYNLITGPVEFVIREDDALKARELLGDLVGPSETKGGSDSEKN